jgi:hypothetical protein
MAKLRPIKRKDLISSLRQLDFTGPYSGGKHEYMQRGRLKVHIEKSFHFLLLTRTKYYHLLQKTSL